MPCNNTLDNPIFENLQARIYVGSRGITELEGQWEKMNSTDMTGFLCHIGWYKSLLKKNEITGEQVLFLLVEDAGEAVAIVPLVYSQAHIGKLTFNVWELYRENDMRVRDTIYNRNYQGDQIIGSIIEALKGYQNHPWSALVFDDIQESSNTMRMLRNYKKNRLASYKSHSSHYIPTDCSYDEYVQRLSGHFRRQLGRTTRKAGKLGELSVEFATEKEQLERAFIQFLDVEASGWKGQGKTAIKLNETELVFYRDLLRYYSKTNQCQINLLYLDGHCIAAQFCVLCETTIYVLKIGYSEDYANIAPGNILFDKLIRYCCDTDTIYAMSFITNSNWQLRWGPESIPIYSNMIMNNTIGGQFLYYLNSTKNMLRKIKRQYVSIRQNVGRGAL